MPSHPSHCEAPKNEHNNLVEDGKVFYRSSARPCLFLCSVVMLMRPRWWQRINKVPVFNCCSEFPAIFTTGARMLLIFHCSCNVLPALCDPQLLYPPLCDLFLQVHPGPLEEWESKISETPTWLCPGVEGQITIAQSPGTLSNRRFWILSIGKTPKQVSQNTLILGIWLNNTGKDKDITFFH